jgi:hypothetical protein
LNTDMLSESELDARLHRANPISRTALDNENIHAALASTLRDLESDARPKATSRSLRRSSYRRRWATFGAAMATAGVASLVGVETLTGGAGGAGLPLAVTPAAAAQLGRVAHAAAAQAAPGAGQFEYIATEIESAGDPSFRGASVNFTYDDTEQSWAGPIPIDESRDRMTSTGVSFASAQDRANYLANKSAFDTRFANSLVTSDPTASGLIGDWLYPTRGRKDEGTLTPLQSEIFNGTERPGSPQELLHDLTLYFDGEPSDLWSGLITILRNATNAQLRATAYQAFAYVPGTTMLGNQKDQLGRAGAAIQFTDHADGWTETVIVSPTTGYLLQDESSYSNSAPGLTSQRTIYLQRTIVNSVTALPDGNSQPFTAASETVNMPKGTERPTLQTTTSASQTTTSTTTDTQSNTSTAADTTTTGAQTTTSTPQTTTAPQTTTSTPQS